MTSKSEVLTCNEMYRYMEQEMHHQGEKLVAEIACPYDKLFSDFGCPNLKQGCPTWQVVLISYLPVKCDMFSEIIFVMTVALCKSPTKLLSADYVVSSSHNENLP